MYFLTWVLGTTFGQPSPPPLPGKTALPAVSLKRNLNILYVPPCTPFGGQPYCRHPTCLRKYSVKWKQQSASHCKDQRAPTFMKFIKDFYD